MQTVYRALFGYTPDEVLGRPIFEPIVPTEALEEKRKW